METEFVTNRQWDGLARRIFKKNIKDRGQSQSEASISRRANTYIIDIQTDRKGLIVKVGWREAMNSEG